MKTKTTTGNFIWRRHWFWLLLASTVVAAGIVLWEVQNDAYWTKSRNSSTNSSRLALGWGFYFLLTFLAASFFFCAWRNLPSSWSRRLYLVGVSLALGLGWQSFLLNWERFEAYSHFDFLGWAGFWAFLVMSGLLFLFWLAGLFCRMLSWRILKRLLFALAVFVLVIGALRIEANWRGQRAWENYRHEWESKGEKFDLAALAPPPVPDDLNFALASIVSNSLAGRWEWRTNRGDYAGQMKLAPLSMNLGRTNYSLNADSIIGVWQLTRPTDLKGWQEYYRTRFVTNGCSEGMPEMPLPRGMFLSNPASTNATSKIIAEFSTDEFPIGNQPQSPADDVLLALSRFDAALAELAEAARRPQSRFPLAYAIPEPRMISLPHLDMLKECAVVLQLRAIAKLQAGKSEQALSDVKMILRLSDSIRNEPMLLSYLVRLNIANLAIQPAWEGLAAKQWTAEQLKELERLLVGLEFLSDWQFALRGERANLIGYIERQRKQRNETAGLLLLAVWPGMVRKMDLLDRSLPEFPELPTPINSSLEALMECLPRSTIDRIFERLPPDGWYEWNKVALAKRCQEQILKLAEIQKKSVNLQELLTAGEIFSAEREAQNFSSHDVLLFQLWPTMSLLAQRSAAVQSAVNMATIACALERYQMVHQVYPDTLSELVPDYLAVIPPDVVNGKPLRYRPTEAGQFNFYSVGWNGQDDGGIITTNEFGRFIPKDGDWVWRYPLKP